MKQINRKQYCRLLDEYWRTCIFIRDNGVCQWNKLNHLKKEGKEAHHIFSRKNLNTRWNLENGILLRGAHNYSKAHTSPEDFRTFLIEKWFKSEDKYRNLYIASALPFKGDLAVWELYLLKELGKLLKKDMLYEFYGLPINNKINKLKEIRKNGISH